MSYKNVLSDARADIALLKSNFATSIISKILNAMIAKQGIDAKIYIHSMSLEHSDSSKRVKLHLDASVDASEDDIYKLINKM